MLFFAAATSKIAASAAASQPAAVDFLQQQILMFTVQTWFWIGFHVLLVILLALDMGVFHRDTHEIKLKEALGWSAFWISLAMLFNLGLYYSHGKEKALLFLGGYILEKSLSVDNLFVFLLIFSFFKVPAKYQHKVLAYGIIGALALRALMIVLGAALVSRFHWILYIFGAFLVYTGIKLFLETEDEEEGEEKIAHNPLLRFCRRFLPITTNYHEDKLFVRVDGKRMVTPLLVVIIVIEGTDVIFAVDSIPAIFGLTTDPFIVYTSNIFAILGLRALFFALSSVIQYFHYLKYGLGGVLSFIGIKMLLEIVHIKIPITWSLAAVFALLGLSVLASLLFKPKEKEVIHLPPDTLPEQTPEITISPEEMEKPALPNPDDPENPA